MNQFLSSLKCCGLLTGLLFFSCGDGGNLLCAGPFFDTRTGALTANNVGQIAQAVIDDNVASIEGDFVVTFEGDIYVGDNLEFTSGLCSQVQMRIVDETKAYLVYCLASGALDSCEPDDITLVTNCVIQDTCTLE